MSRGRDGLGPKCPVTDLMSFSTVFHPYQDDVWMIMNGYVQ